MMRLLRFLISTFSILMTVFLRSSPLSLLAAFTFCFNSLSSCQMIDIVSWDDITFLRVLFCLRFIVIIYHLSQAMRKILFMTTAILGQLYYFIRNYLTRQKNKKLITLLYTMKVLSPNQLINKLKSIKQDKLFELCKGKIYASEPCHSVLKPQLQVVYSSLFQGPYSSTPSKSNLLRVTEPSYMQLKSGGDSIKLFETHNSVIFPTRLIKFKAASLRERLISAIKSVFIHRQPSNTVQYNQFYNYLNVYQLFVPEGAECTVLGDFCKEGKQVVCTRPKMIFQNQQQMIAFLERSIKSLNLVNILLIISFIFCAVTLLKELYRMIKQYSRDVSNGSGFNGLRKIFVKSRVCSICKKNLSCLWNKKCEHMVICQQCIDKPASACLECNQKACDYVEMFVC